MLATPVPNTFKTSAEIAAALSDETGSGPLVFADSPTIVTPTIASIIGNKIYPAADSATAIQILKADGTTPVVTIDTTSGYLGIGTTSVESPLHIKIASISLAAILETTGNLATTGKLYVDLRDASGSSAYIGFGWESNSCFEVHNRENGPLLFSTSGLGRIRILAGGNVLIGNATGTARLHLPAGTTVAGAAPFKFTLSGASPLTIAEAGVLEPDSLGNLYITNSSAKRKPLNQQYVLASLIGADFNVTTDQAITIPAGRWVVRKIVVNNASISLTAATGGIYTAISKGGTAIVAAAQVYSALTASSKFLDLTLGAGMATDILTATTIYFSLTTAQGAAATGDIFIIGDRLDF